MPETIKILVADDHTLMRSGLKLLLEGESDFEVVGEATTGEEATSLCSQLQPDVVLMDIGMPEMNGLEATRLIKEENPGIYILVLTMHRSEEYFFQMLEAGASGYVLKGAETSELIHAIRAVAQGDVFLYPSMARRLVQEYLARLEVTPSSDPSLTPREREILQLIVGGYSGKEIAEKLVISPSTVHSHSTNLMAKLNLNTRHELVRYARDHGLLP
jgi:two-component system response regulator NreC